MTIIETTKYRLVSLILCANYWILLIENEIKNSPESVNLQSDMKIESIIDGFYKKYLKRSADPMGLKHYKQQILGGVSFSEIENEIKNSQESKWVSGE